MNKYQLNKAKAQDKAIQWQREFNEHNYSYGELYEFGNIFYKLGKRYGLLKEFRENGIIWLKGDKTMKALFWTTTNGFLCSQGIESETETEIKLINHARAIPKSVIGNENKTFYGKHFFATEQKAEEYLQAISIPF